MILAEGRYNPATAPALLICTLTRPYAVSNWPRQSVPAVRTGRQFARGLFIADRRFSSTVTVSTSVSSSGKCRLVLAFDLFHQVGVDLHSVTSIWIIFEFEKAEPKPGSGENWRRRGSTAGARCQMRVFHASRHNRLADRWAADLLDRNDSPAHVRSNGKIKKACDDDCGCAAPLRYRPCLDGLIEQPHRRA